VSAVVQIVPLMERRILSTPYVINQSQKTAVDVRISVSIDGEIPAMTSCVC